MNFFVYYLLPFIVVLGVLIFFHELGHFLIAKLFRVKVLKFSLGFGPKLAGWKFGDTEYLISAVPLGGYVKMLGESESEEDDEEIPPEDLPKTFNNQHVLKRIAIVGAGPFFNMLLAAIVFCSFYMVAGVSIMVPEIGQVREESPALKAGLKKGDIIVSAEGEAVESWSRMKEVVKKSENKPLQVTVKREGEYRSFTVVPETATVKNVFGEDVKSVLIGIVASGKTRQVDIAPGEAVFRGLAETWRVTKLTCQTIVKLLERVVPLKALGGPIMIGQLTGKVAQENLGYLFPLIAIISVNLAILNLLPVPILDGGLIIFLLIELVRGKPLSVKNRQIAQKVGLFLLVLLMIVVMYNDVTRLLE